MSDADLRTEELADRLAELNGRLARACISSGRKPTDVTNVIVTKTWPVEDVRRLWSLGVRDMAENRDQDAKAKADECSDLPITWHFVGQLQRNKAASVAKYVNFVHSVDRPALVKALDSGAERAERRIGCFVQVLLAPASGTDSASRGGVALMDVAEVCQAVSDSKNLDLVGLMAVPPLGEAPEAAFERLNEVRGAVMKDFPEAAWLSAGMSGDLEAAIAAGATHVRVGSAVLGERKHVR